MSRFLLLKKQAEHSFTCCSNYLIFVIDLAILLEAGLTLLLLRGSVLCHHDVVALFCKRTRFLFYGHELYYARVRLSFETSFDSKHPKLEPKLVSALSETTRLFRFYSFGVSVKPNKPRKFFCGFVIQLANNRNRLIFFLCFEDTLAMVRVHLECNKIGGKKCFLILNIFVYSSYHWQRFCYQPYLTNEMPYKWEKLCFYSPLRGLSGRRRKWLPQILYMNLITLFYVFLILFS